MPIAARGRHEFFVVAYDPTFGTQKGLKEFPQGVLENHL